MIAVAESKLPNIPFLNYRGFKENHQVPLQVRTQKLCHNNVLYLVIMKRYFPPPFLLVFLKKEIVVSTYDLYKGFNTPQKTIQDISVVVI